ncbi:MAG TPA: haloacid dehalogenase type II [Phycisphaerae bacterium]|nr:haloacid dehalogenase type II [Phycisphaerae bacterium]
MQDFDPSKIKLITFDCYGTLIDWETGLQNSLASLAGVTKQLLPDLVQQYVQTEAAIEQQAYQSYSAIQRQTIHALAERHRLPVSPESADLLSQDIGNWVPFADTIDALKRLKSRFMLGILSNIDIDLFARTNRRLGIEFDLIITAEDVRSYKPSHEHFLRALEQSRLGKGEILHVAQSLFHDAAPAAALCFNFVWINRYNQSKPDDVPMIKELPDLKSLADLLQCPPNPTSSASGTSGESRS